MRHQRLVGILVATSAMGLAACGNEIHPSGLDGASGGARDAGHGGSGGGSQARDAGSGGARDVGNSDSGDGSQAGNGGSDLAGSGGVGGAVDSGSGGVLPVDLGGSSDVGGSGGSGLKDAATDGSTAADGADAGAGAWNSQNNGNPFVPGYFADPSIFYDADSATFYVFATTDGNWISYSAQPTAWYSKDFLHWRAQPLVLPSIWPAAPLWAPSIVKHPTNGQYYLLYSIGASNNAGAYIARAPSPLGPWTNATSGTTTVNAALYREGQMWGANDWLDAQFFVDDDQTVYMTFGGSGSCGIARLAFGSDGVASIDNTDSRMVDGTTHKFKKLPGLTNYLEGSTMFRDGSRYYLTYSSSACQNYNVQYAVASSPVGPFTHMNGKILERTDAKHVLGPGHNSILRYGNDWYIVYHRQHYPYVDVKRQTSIDRIIVNGDTISADVQTHEGVLAGSGSLETLVSAARASAETNLAFGRPVLASSESDYKGGQSGNIVETFAAVPGLYAGRYAVDQSNGTRWAPTTLPGTLIVDLGTDRSVGRCETTFEYVLRAYRYRIDYLTNAEAASLAEAQLSTAWHMFADRSSNTERLSPVVDVGAATARYLRMTVLSADIPTASDETRTIRETDYADRVSVVEFKAFEASGGGAADGGGSTDTGGSAADSGSDVPDASLHTPLVSADAPDASLDAPLDSANAS